MQTTPTRTILGLLLTILGFVGGLITLRTEAQAQCGPIDVVFVVDDTSSMGGAINNVKAELNNIFNDIEKASGRDYRMALVTFKDNVTVRENFSANNRDAIGAKILTLTAEGGGRIPEASDEALNTVINTLAASGRQQVGDFTPAFRERAFRMIILITDAIPGGFDDTYTVGVDDKNMQALALQAKDKGIKVSTIYVPTFPEDTLQLKPIYEGMATTTAGFYLGTAQNGTGTAAAIRTIIAGCGSTTTTPAIGVGVPSEVKPGSVLFFNLYASDPAKPQQENTQINITNTDPDRGVMVHLFWVDSATGLPTDTFVCIPATKHVNLRASEIDPGVTGYLLAVAVDLSGVPIKFNSLIGTTYVKLKTGHQAMLNAVAFTALVDRPVQYDELLDTNTTLKFDGLKYDISPRVLAVDNFSSPLDGASTLLVINRFGGNLTGEGPVGVFGNLPAVFYNDAEKPFNVNLPGGASQTRNELRDGYPRVIPRLSLQIPAGRTGWLRLSAGDGVSLMGALLTHHPNAVRSGGKNLRQVATMDVETYTIPVKVPTISCQ